MYFVGNFVSRAMEPYVRISEKQKCFRHSTEFLRLVYLYFVDLTIALYRARLSDITDILKQNNIPQGIIRIVQAGNLGTSTRIKTEVGFTSEIRTTKRFAREIR